MSMRLERRLAVGQCRRQRDRLVRWHGRMVVKDGDAWKLRADKLASGAPAPFVLDRALFFQILRDLPAGAGKVLHSETTSWLASSW